MEKLVMPAFAAVIIIVAFLMSAYILSFELFVCRRRLPNKKGEEMTNINDFTEEDRVRIKHLEPELVAKKLYPKGLEVGDRGTVVEVDRAVRLVFVKLDKGIKTEFLPAELEKI